MLTSGKKTPPADYRVEAARRKWADFLEYVSDDVKGVEIWQKWVREMLTAATADAAILDPTGQKTAAEMEAEIDAATKAAYLRSARKIWSGYPAKASDEPDFIAEYSLKNIRECLTRAGAALEDLDPDNLKTAADVEAAFEAGKKNIFLNSAKKMLKALEENDTIGYEMSSTKYKCDNIRRWAEASGKGIEALIASNDLPPALRTASTVDLRRHVEERMDKARRRTALICARHKLAEFEGEHPVSGDQVDWFVNGMFDELAFSGHARQDLDPTGNSTAEDVDRRLEVASRRCYRRTVESEIRDFIDRPAREPGTQVYFMDKINKFLANAGTDLRSLGMEGKYAPDIVERKFAELEPRSAVLRAMHALESFEKSGLMSLSDLRETGARVTGLFNTAAVQLAQEHADDPDFRGKFDARINAANKRARDHYYAMSGKVPVLKRLQLKKSPGA